MKKLTIFIFILLLCSCNKTEQKQEAPQTADTTETQQLTEAECWVLFDKFWEKFQKAIVEEDTAGLREMCEFREYSNLLMIGEKENNEEKLDFLLKTKTEFKKLIKKVNNIKYHFENYDTVFFDKYNQKYRIEGKDYLIYIEYFEDNRFQLYMNYESKHYKRCYECYGIFILINDKYKLVWLH